MGSRANDDLYQSLDKIIESLNDVANAGIKLPPNITRNVALTLGVVRDCHRSLAEYEDLMEAAGNVIPIHSVKAKHLGEPA